MPPQPTNGSRLPRELYAFTLNTAALLAALSIIGGVIYGAAKVFGAEWLNLPEKVASIEERLGAAVPPPAPFIAFVGAPFGYPQKVKAGDTLRIVYFLRRITTCPTTVTRRWWSVELNAYDSNFFTHEAVQPAPVTERFEIVSRRVTVPDLPPGTWAYHPLISCPGVDPVDAPPAFFEVERK